MKHLVFEGQPVLDRRMFCLKHNCKLMKVRYRRWGWNPYLGEESVVEDWIGPVPSLFLDGLRLGPARESVEILEEIPL